MITRILIAAAFALTPIAASAQSPAVEAAIEHAQNSYDSEATTAILAEGCNGGDSVACTYWLSMLHRSYDDEAEIEARTLATRLCDADDGLACITLANWAEDGRGGEIDRALQRTSLTKACRLGIYDACSTVADLAFEGRGGPQDSPFARQIAREGCEAGHAQTCLTQGRLLRQSSWDADSEEQGEGFNRLAREAFAKGCEGNAMEACSSLADMMLEGQGGEEDREGALELMKRGCVESTYRCDTYLRALGQF